MRLVRIVEVRPLEGYKLWLRFDDGSEGVVTFDEAEFAGVMAPLKDPAFFAQAHVEPEFGALAWPGEIELDPLTLYTRVTGKPLTEKAPS